MERINTPLVHLAENKIKINIVPELCSQNLLKYAEVAAVLWVKRKVFVWKMFPAQNVTSVLATSDLLFHFPPVFTFAVLILLILTGYHECQSITSGGKLNCGYPTVSGAG